MLNLSWNWVTFASDNFSPPLFWITNGWNDFQGNMAAGAGACGVCYWEIPAQINADPSASEQWLPLTQHRHAEQFSLARARDNTSEEFRRQFLAPGDEFLSNRRQPAALFRRRPDI